MKCKIITRLDEKQNQLLEQIEKQENSNELTFLKQFILEFNPTDIQNINTTDVIIAYIITKTDIPIEKVTKAVHNNNPLFHKCNSLYFINNISIIFRSINEGTLEYNRKPLRKIENFFLSLLKVGGGLEDLIDIMKIEPEVTQSCFELIGYIKKVQEEISKATKKGTEPNFENIRYKKLNGQYYKMESAKQMLETIKGNCEYLISNSQKERKRKEKEYKKYSFIKEWCLENEQKDEVFEIPSQILNINDSELKLSIMKRIYIHNQKYYKKVNQKLKEAKENESEYQTLFIKYGLDTSQINKYLTYNIEKLEWMITTLKDLGISSSEQILYIISNSEYDSIKEISNFVSKRCITKEFLAKNQVLFTSSYDDLVNNIRILKEKEVPNTTILKMEGLLLNSQQQFSKNIQVLDSYHMIESLKNTTSYDFLNSNFLEHLIDQLLELNFEKYLKEELDFLNINSNVLNRVILLNLLHMGIETKEELQNILFTTKFGIPDENLDSYIFDITPYIEDNLSDVEISKEAFLKKLEECKLTENTYQLNGVIISSNKVSRNLDSIEGDYINANQQLRCIISNKKLSNEDYNQIRSFITKEKHMIKK